MDNRKRQMLIAEAPDGTLIRHRTGAAYDWAGLGHSAQGWSLIAKGWSQASVERHAMERSGGGAWVVVPFRTAQQRAEKDPAIPAEVTEYFEGRRFPDDPAEVPQITSVFRPDEGWSPVAETKPATLGRMRMLRRQGVTAVAIGAYGRQADFPVESLLRRTHQPLVGGAVIGSRTWKAR